MKPLTLRQRDVLLLIQRGLDEHGIVPTIRELTDQLGLGSARGVHQHLHAIQKKGWIRIERGHSRAITILFRTVPIIHYVDRS